MEINYIFLEKDKKTKIKNPVEISNSDIIPFYQKLFLNIAKQDTVTSDKFDVEFEKQNFEIHYNYIYNDNREHYLTIYISQNDNLKIAKVLNYINNNIKKSIIHKDYYIIQTYDESSKYLCNKIYPKFNEFERKIRRVIYLILIKAFGKLWVQEAISDDLKYKLKSKINSTDAMIEQALQEMDINDLEDFLFKSRYWYNIEDIISNELCIENINNLNKDEIIKLLEKIQKYNLWNKCFSEIKVTNLEEKLEKIRKLRNKVAHFKEITLEEYTESQKLLKSIIKEIDFAIRYVSLKNYDISISKDIVISFAEMTQKIIESLNTLLKPININAVSNTLTSIVEQLELSKPKIPEGIFPQLANPFLGKPVIEVPKINDIFEKAVTPMPFSTSSYIKPFELPPSLIHTQKLALNISHCIQPTFKNLKNTKKCKHRKP